MCDNDTFAKTNEFTSVLVFIKLHIRIIGLAHAIRMPF